MSYDNVVVGGLKLKGVGEVADEKKKKEKKRKREEAEVAASGAQEEEKPKDDGKTESERNHEFVRKKRMMERIESRVHVDHRKRMEALNEHFSTLSDHHDIPRVGPG